MDAAEQASELAIDQFLQLPETTSGQAVNIGDKLHFVLHFNFQYVSSYEDELIFFHSVCRAARDETALAQ
ncbi:hypothetical protein [Rhizobium nepotum]|uniref:hypothetical protein n=1 Tax=Rhizobium nepotum TaxID=1035271 RepID=UPI003CEEE781